MEKLRGLVFNGANLPNATDFIFNKGTAITAEVKCEVGGDDTQIWLKIQKI